MQEKIEQINATIGLAVRQGVSQARIALQPAELGEIRVHLSQSSQGLVVRLTADSSAGAQLLSAGRVELHHSLSTLGTALLRLEIGSSGEPAGGHGRQAGGTGSEARGQRTTDGDASIETEEETAGETTEAVSGAPRGELVDVLA
jgi:flagellar hook-length control protein FliK